MNYVSFILAFLNGKETKDIIDQLVTFLSSDDKGCYQRHIFVDIYECKDAFKDKSNTKFLLNFFLYLHSIPKWK